MAGIEIVSIVAIVVAGAILIPIVFNENPAAFLENGLCVIFAGPTNTTCNAIKGNVTFVGIPPIVITADNLANTLTWNFTLAAENATHGNIGGGAEVFKNETLGTALFRTLVGGGGVSVTQNAETISIATGGPGGPPLSNINNGTGNVFSTAAEGDTVTFVGKGISITNSSSVTFTLNATADELRDVDYPTPPDENQILFFNITTGNFENVPLANLISLVDVFFNSEEATVDDLTGVDCVNDVTLSFFDNTAINQYRRQAIEFCSSGDIDDNITWFYTVPKDIVGSGDDFKFRLFWTDDDIAAGAFQQTTSNDCEESIGPLGPAGDVGCNSTDLEMHAENILEADDNDLIAMRWTGVTVPQGATITSANIQFHVDSTNPNDPIILRLKGHDIDNSPVLTVADFDISSRANTTAFVDWNIPDWVSVSDEGPAQLTPDLSTIIQEIVDRPGWVSGNDITIKSTEWIGCTPTSCPVNFGKRHAEAAEGEAANAAELTINFAIAPTNPPVCFEFSLQTVGMTELLDGSFIARDTQCVNRSGADRLTVTEFTVLASDHQFSAEDNVYLRIVRPDNFVPDDFESNVFVLGAELQWLN